ncbi:MAG: hypothetical protein ABSG11_22660 [Candidatus Korobacteraceae bacterium]
MPRYLTFSNAHPYDVTFASDAITKASAAKGVSDPDRTARAGKTRRFLLSCFGKRSKDARLTTKKASGTFTNSKTRSCHLFSVIYAEDKRIDGKTVGKKLSGNFTNAQTGTMLYAQQNAAPTNNRRMAVSVHIKAVFEAVQARKRRKK